jgi:hypothetical protein
MTRQDLGFVISRAMAVWLIVMLMQNLSYALYGLLLYLRSEDYKLIDLATPVCIGGMYLGLAWLLWFRADVFAGSHDPEKPGGTSINGRELFEALAAMVGLYYAASGVARTISLTAMKFYSSEVRDTFSAYGTSWYDACAEFVVGVAMMLIFSPRVRRAVVKFWSLSDDEEAKASAESEG